MATLLPCRSKHCPPRHFTGNRPVCTTAKIGSARRGFRLEQRDEIDASASAVGLLPQYRCVVASGKSENRQVTSRRSLARRRRARC